MSRILSFMEFMSFRGRVKIRDYKPYLLNDDKPHGANIKQRGVRADTGDCDGCVILRYKINYSLITLISTIYEVV